MKILIALLAASFVASGVAVAEDGAALYKSKMCGACHGAGKKGGDLKGNPMDKAAMVKYMKDPKSVNPKATMPVTKASDAELSAIADYVKTLK